MNFVRRRTDALEVNLTPLIDVVFLLLIFFMVSTSFKLETQIDLELPTADGQSESTSDLMVVSVSSRGEYAINDAVVLSPESAALTIAIQSAIETLKPEHVVLMADARASHQNVVTLLDILTQVGVTRVQIKTQSNSEAPN
ncbi:MAG: biopolymer transporter ExbD [Pseudomonadales bacterium]|nr:biopolymer transporter ExbD [Pseudomonadales bacterium]